MPVLGVPNCSNELLERRYVGSRYAQRCTNTQRRVLEQGRLGALGSDGSPYSMSELCLRAQLQQSDPHEV